VPDLAEVYAARVDLLQHVAERLEADLLEHFREVPHIDRISTRVKGIDSFVEKATVRKIDPPYSDPLTEIEDQIAGRILVLFTSDLEPTVKRVAELVNPVEQDHKRPTRYNEFDYESVHGIYAVPPQFLPASWNDQDDMPTTFELQIRTLFQHAYAEPQHDLGYKPDVPLGDEERRELAWIAASAWGGDQALDRVREKLSEAR
jgi:GTP pyrophosphokinase